MLVLLAIVSWVTGASLLKAAEAGPPDAVPWDTYSDTWVATDALGRSVPTFAEVGPPRQDRFVGMFYFLWLGAHVNGGPYDITRILAQDPQAMQKKESPLWGPLHAPHHWGESVFGYYLTDDPFVLRKHAQMLADAGVDTLVFDVTNQVTYKDYYLALLRVFAEVRRLGGKTPQVAFLCPFWDPAKVVAELWKDLYEPGLYPELWFRWDGKPLVLADPDKLGPSQTHAQGKSPVRLEPGHTLGQSFEAERPLAAVGGSFPTFHNTNSAMTLTLYRDGPGGERLASRRFERVEDNAWLLVQLETALQPGLYYLEMSDSAGPIAWWSHSGDVLAQGTAFADGATTGGDRNLRIIFADNQGDRIRTFFTFRKPQPDYFRGPTSPDMWSWLEIHPQHVFKNSRGEKEQMSVGVAQNAVTNRLGSMSEPDARGRSFHKGGTVREPDAVRQGYNLAEQFEQALAEDPKFIFITGWNEWIAGRFDEFNGVRRPVMFVDQFDQEHSRDIEPMRGGHGDSYYYQTTSFIRRFKGAHPAQPASPPKTIDLAGGFAQWNDVQPEFRDDIGDPVRRDHPGYNNCARYTNFSGRNDLVLMKVTSDAAQVYFYARTQAPVSSCQDPQWMLLFIDADSNHHTGWEGYDFIVNRVIRGENVTTLERNVGGWKWEPVAELKQAAAGQELHLAVPRAALGPASASGLLRFDFKWADHVPESGDMMDFLTHGDTAPNGRFNYRFLGK